VANEEEPRNPEEEPGGPEEEELSPDPFVERLRPDPSQPPIPVRVLEGLLGESDREGYWRLYFSRELDNYAEFRAEDVVFSERIPPDQSPFLGLDATRVGIRRDATVEFTRARTPRPVDEFDLDIRLGALGGPALAAGPVTIFDGPCDTPGTICAGTICDACGTQERTRCIPCGTQQEQTRCIPCGTQQEQTRCIPCGTREQTRCIPCDIDTFVGRICPTRPLGCPTGPLRCPRTIELPRCF
jgi:hypothetical protein